jgi:indolepyruvate ferredoxin oxidoreductase, alpha subunit
MLRYGWEVLTDALVGAGLDLIVCVPGKPVTPVQNALVESGHARWVNHEAAAAQYAMGASGCGDRAVLLVKQVGMNVAADVLACAAPHRTGGSMVVVVGDDPNTVSSQVEGDSRRLAVSVEAPCFEPAGPADIPSTLEQALALSTTLRAPVVFRVTTAMMLMRQVEAPEPRAVSLPAAAPFDNDFWKVDFTGHRRLLLEGIHTLPEDDAYDVRRGSSGLRIVASGQPAADARDLCEHDLFAVRRVFPIPAQALGAFLDSASAPILVLEEGGPLLEDEVRAQAGSAQVFGRRSGHVAWAGPVDVESSLAAARAGSPLRLGPLPLYQMEPSADLGPFGDLWLRAEELGLTPIAVDAGHCGEAVALPGGPAPLSYGLGSAIGVAAGIALARKQAAIAVTGDMGAFHGLPGLVQAVRDQLPVIVFVEDDGAATTTGGQPTPSGPTSNGERAVSLVALARGLGIDRVETVKRDSMRGPSLRGLLKDLSELSGPSLVIIDEKPV